MLAELKRVRAFDQHLVSPWLSLGVMVMHMPYTNDVIQNLAPKNPTNHEKTAQIIQAPPDS